jgi:hypothetical protein
LFSRETAHARCNTTEYARPSIWLLSDKMAQSTINPRSLNELTIAEAFFACVLKHPEVVSLAASALPGSWMFDHVFRDGCYPGPYIDYHWPLNVVADDLAFHFVKPIVIFLDDPLPTAPRALIDVCGLLVEQIKTLRDLLIAGHVVAHGTFAATGSISEISRFEWRRNIIVDLKNSDLLEQRNDEPVAKWTGVFLRSSTDVASETVSDQTKRASNRKDTAHRASIRAAVASLWPEGIPAGIEVKTRDRMINKWQHDNDQAVTSGKTIQRELDGK